MTTYVFTRQKHRKCRFFDRRLSQFDAALAALFENVATNKQPESGPRGFRREVGLEYFVSIGRSDAVAVIGDVNFQPARFERCRNGNGAAIGGLKISTERGWFAARPSGTEDVVRLYAESFVDERHLKRIQDEARNLLKELFDIEGA